MVYSKQIYDFFYADVEFQVNNTVYFLVQFKIKLKYLLAGEISIEFTARAEKTFNNENLGRVLKTFRKVFYFILTYI